MSGSSLTLLSPWPSWLPLMPPSCSCYKQCYKYFVVKEFFVNSFLCLQRQMALSGLPSVRVHWGPACLWPWIVTGPVYLQSVTAYFDRTSLPSVCDHGLWHDQSTSNLWPWIVTGPVYLQSVNMDFDRIVFLHPVTIYSVHQICFTRWSAASSGTFQQITALKKEKRKKEKNFAVSNMCPNWTSPDTRLLNWWSRATVLIIPRVTWRRI